MLRRASLRSERGSALVLVMFIVLLLTILGVTVLSATIGGARRAETRENDVQSLHLAQKSIDEAIAYITANLNKKIQVSSNTTQAQFDQEIEMFLRGSILIKELLLPIQVYRELAMKSRELLSMAVLQVVSM